MRTAGLLLVNHKMHSEQETNNRGGRLTAEQSKLGRRESPKHIREYNCSAGFPKFHDSRSQGVASENQRESFQCCGHAN